MKIGESVQFLAVFEGDVTKPVRSVGTVADVRDGHAWVFVLGYRWPFAIRQDDELRVGEYPHSQKDPRYYTWDGPVQPDMQEAS